MQTFETCTAMLKMHEKHYFEHPVAKITPPEYRVLQVVHGRDALSFMELSEGAFQSRKAPDGSPQRRAVTQTEEYDRLVVKYGAKQVKGAFPGEAPRLPYTFEEAGISTVVPDNIVSMRKAEKVVDDGWVTVDKQSTLPLDKRARI